MNIKRILVKLKVTQQLFRGTANYSFSQVGEDIIIKTLLRDLGITAPAYLEIGSNHPVVDNNTYLFYLKGGSGVCVEPDKVLYDAIKKQRPNDTVLNVGVGINGTTEADFYAFPQPYTGWNTFSKTEADKRVTETGVAFSQVRKVKMLGVNEIMRTYFTGGVDVLSLDVEGLDLAIIKELDFALHSPKIICIETVLFSNTLRKEKNEELIAYILDRGYVTYADTYINTIFCRRDLL
jgi:FkbM family methyltransferase